MKSKEFNRKADAVEFAKEVKGFCEGSFLDDKMNAERIVFWKEEKYMYELDYEGDMKTWITMSDLQRGNYRALLTV